MDGSITLQNVPFLYHNIAKFVSKRSNQESMAILLNGWSGNYVRHKRNINLFFMAFVYIDSNEESRKMAFCRVVSHMEATHVE